MLICMPYNSTIKFVVSADGWDVPEDQKAFIGLYTGSNWLFTKEGASDYYLEGTFTGYGVLNNPGERAWINTIEIPKARVNVLSENSGVLAK